LFGSVTVLILLVGAQIIFCAFCGWLANEKGYNVGAWILLGLLFGFIAFLAIGFAPIKSEKNYTGNTNKTNATGNSGDTWNCPKCNTENKGDTFTCCRCGYKIV
jgi:hypothetical protein